MTITLPVLNVAVVDQDHQAAVDLIQKAMTCPEADLAALMAEAATHLTEHFAREEAMMDECGFFAAHCHKDEHRRVLAEAGLVVQAADNGNLAQVRDYLTTDFPAWLVQHAESMDTVTMMSYRTYLNSKRSPVAC